MSGAIGRWARVRALRRGLSDRLRRSGGIGLADLAAGGDPVAMFENALHGALMEDVLEALLKRPPYQTAEEVVQKMLKGVKRR